MNEEEKVKLDDILSKYRIAI